jgi:hypothetical protein
MYCPKCATNQRDDLKFCKQCGANLYAVRQVMSKREVEEKFDWSKTWVAQMFLSEDEREKRKQLIEEERGITPEVKRYNEIKAGVITSSVGIAAMIFFYVLMKGIVLSGEVKPGEAEILSRLWVLGVVPFFIGVGLMINGIIVSKKQIEAMKRNQLPNEETDKQKSFGKNTDRLYLEPADSSEFIPSGFSVTEGTTKTLQKPEQKT